MMRSGRLSMGKTFPCNPEQGSDYALLFGKGTGVSCGFVLGRALRVASSASWPAVARPLDANWFLILWFWGTAWRWRRVVAHSDHFEEALQEMKRPEEGEWFFFRSIDTATASPEEMFLAPVWEQAFGTTKTPLLILEEQR